MTSEALGEERPGWGRGSCLPSFAPFYAAGLSALGVSVPGPSPRSGGLTTDTPTYSHFNL